MANPKRKTSKARRNRRRAHDALSSPSQSTCSNCGEVKLSHRACPHCGFYRGREVVDVEETV
ncbi:MAG: 50S ribosomal protein L32 [Acidobacteriota bacterium]|nr:50S ribosomal protein L32 [Acidobacteriota bacterium]